MIDNRQRTRDHTHTHTHTPQDPDQAAAYLRALFHAEEHLALVAIDRIAGRHPEQRICQAGAVTAPKFQAFLRHLNAEGYDIFVSMNPVKPERRRREKQDVAKVRRLQLDLDRNGPESLHRVLADVHAGALPRPAAVVRSSRHNYQVIWHADPDVWTAPEAEDTMRRLAAEYGGDSSVADVARVMRLPGFRNKKPERDDAPVRWTDHAGRKTHPHAFAHLPEVELSPPRSAAAGRQIEGRDNSQSARDWAYAKDQLRKGVPQEKVIAALEKRRAGEKHDPHYYAERTTRKAFLDIQRPRTRTQPSR
ncbi:MAG: DNA-primase RepB domain-containing protein [Acidobacteria bacterium]|nr:DNA-primase RepB domain-containing protein [Acidobacteriota bacterium]